MKHTSRARGIHRALLQAGLVLFGSATPFACATTDDGTAGDGTAGEASMNSIGEGAGHSGGLDGPSSSAGTPDGPASPVVSSGAPSPTGAPESPSDALPNASTDDPNPSAGASMGTGETGSEQTTGSAGATNGADETLEQGPGGAANVDSGGDETGAAGAEGVVPGRGRDVVTRSSSTFTFEHFPIQTNADDVWDGPMSPSAQPTSSTFDTVVLENGYLQVTLLPDYGGRILSIVHKPTARELLYQNPLGTPYLMYEGIFYYDYLAIMGGIFPSFPEPEHGRYWNQPYRLEVVSESDEAITVRMSRQDDRDIVAGVPDAYDVGRTDVLVELEVTLRAGSTALELDTRLTNTRNTAIPAFEYWTVTTLAPGSSPGDTAIPLDTRIVAEMEQVHLLEGSWSWFGSAETRISDEIFRWNNLSYFENWVDQGTAFANPEYRAGWSGLINYQNDMGVLRVSDNTQTRGLKLWTFGSVSLSADISDPNEWLRPTIEMWHGITPEFWDRATLAANEVREWREHYLPTLGLREVTAATEHGAVYLSQSEMGADTALDAAATLTSPEQTVTAILRLDGNVVAEQELVVATTEATSVSAVVPTSSLSSGSVFEAEFVQGDRSLLVGQLVLP